jgi:hypothetical protein
MSTATLNLVVRLLIFSILIIPRAGLTLLQRLPEVKAMLAEDTLLHRMGANKLDSLRHALKLVKNHLIPSGAYDGRAQAADYEPLDKGGNKAACDRIAAIKWTAYKYSLILVPGANGNRVLSAAGSAADQSAGTPRPLRVDK